MYDTTKEHLTNRQASQPGAYRYCCCGSKSLSRYVHTFRVVPPPAFPSRCGGSTGSGRDRRRYSGSRRPKGTVPGIWETTARVRVGRTESTNSVRKPSRRYESSSRSTVRGDHHCRGSRSALGLLHGRDEIKPGQAGRFHFCCCLADGVFDPLEGLLGSEEAPLNKAGATAVFERPMTIRGGREIRPGAAPQVKVLHKTSYQVLESVQGPSTIGESTGFREQLLNSTNKPGM